MRIKDLKLEELIEQARAAYARTRSVEVVLEVLRDGCSSIGVHMNPEEILEAYEEEIIKWVVRP